MDSNSTPSKANVSLHQSILVMSPDLFPIITKRKVIKQSGNVRLSQLVISSMKLLIIQQPHYNLTQKSC